LFILFMPTITHSKPTPTPSKKHHSDRIFSLHRLVVGSFCGCLYRLR
jgi:hypothetical protein